MIRVPPALEKASLRARMLLQVHDELLLEVPEGEVEKTSAVVREVMENACHPAVQLSVPLVADAGTGRNCSAVVREVMENACHPAVQLSVPLVADAGTGRNWAEAH